MQVRPKNIYIVHGYLASSNAHWFPWLSQKIKQAGHYSKRVVLAQSTQPDFDEWQKCLKLQIPLLDEHSIVIAHSLGCLATLQYLNEYFKRHNIQIRAGFFIAGFNMPLKAIPELDHFIQQAHLDSGILQTGMPFSVQYLSTNDPFVPPPIAIQFGHYIHAQVIDLGSSGHFMKEDGFSEFPQLWKAVQAVLDS